MFYQIFLSPQVKRWTIVTNKHGIYQLSHIRNVRKVSKRHRMIAQCPASPGKIKILSVIAKESRNIVIKPFPRCAIPHETKYKNPNNPIDLILTNTPRNVQSTCVVETLLSDFHLMALTVMKKSFKKFHPLTYQL